MSMTDQEWQEEQQRVERVTREINRQMETLQKQVGDARSDIVDIRKHFWDDVTVNFDEADDVAETYAALKQQAELLSERERTHRVANSRLIMLAKLKSSPYFGRIDFKEAGESNTERIYLGLSSLLEEDALEYLIYDWRAPVSSLYYDYPPGPAEYETPGGSVKGSIELKRQYIIRDGSIQSLFDTGVTIGDELLQEVLGKQADPQMRSIVATIQKEQNRIIRNTKSRVLIVSGAAGSGKTSAALQRVAYLLYRYRDTLRSEQIVLFSPNPMFNSYVSTVLPELGEANMQQTTFQEYLEHRLGDSFRLEDPFEQMETALTGMNTPGYEARMEGIRYKASKPFMKLIDRYVAFLGAEALVFHEIRFRGETLVAAEQIQAQFYALDASLPIPNRLKLVSEWLLKELRAKARLEVAKPWVDEEIELLDQDAYLHAYQELRRKSKKSFSGETFDDFQRERQQLAIVVVQELFKPLRVQAKKLRFVDVSAVYRQLFADPAFAARLAQADVLPGAWAAICEETTRRLDAGELAYEDATPYLYMKERIEGFQTNTGVRHVFVDEAQDYSAFQFAFLKRLFPFSKLTLLGDLNQAIYAHAAADGFTPLTGLYGAEETEMLELTRTYRSTRQIVEFTRLLIPGGEAIVPFNRQGEKPSLTHAGDKPQLIRLVAARIRALQAARHRTIAVICKTADESREAFNALSAEMPVRLIDKETVSFEAGVLVIPSYLAKGVEFDAVIIFNASNEQYGRESERKLFYTACTRAMHELHLYYTGERSPLLAEADSDTYEVIQQ